MTQELLDRIKNDLNTMAIKLNAHINEMRSQGYKRWIEKHENLSQPHELYFDEEALNYSCECGENEETHGTYLDHLINIRDEIKMS